MLDARKSTQDVDAVGPMVCGLRDYETSLPQLGNESSDVIVSDVDIQPSRCMSFGGEAPIGLSHQFGLAIPSGSTQKDYTHGRSAADPIAKCNPIDQSGIGLGMQGFEQVQVVGPFWEYGRTRSSSDATNCGSVDAQSDTNSSELTISLPGAPIHDAVGPRDATLQ